MTVTAAVPWALPASVRWNFHTQPPRPHWPLPEWDVYGNKPGGSTLSSAPNTEPPPSPCGSNLVRASRHDLFNLNVSLPLLLSVVQLIGEALATPGPRRNSERRASLWTGVAHPRTAPPRAAVTHHYTRRVGPAPRLTARPQLSRRRSLSGWRGGAVRCGPCPPGGVR